MKTLVVSALIGIGAITFTQMNQEYSNTIEDGRMLIVLTAPWVHELYYEEDFEETVAFQKEYAKKILGNDNVVIVVDEDTKEYYDDMPQDILLEAEIDDIWMRDFTTVHPEAQVQFGYDPEYLEEGEGPQTQSSFERFAGQLGLRFAKSDLILDGGNVVDNGAGKIVVSERFLEDNELSYEAGVAALQSALGVQEVAIIRYDDDVLGHADGMVMWADEHTLIVNTYEDPLRSAVLKELHNALSGISIVEVPMQFTDSTWRTFRSACGVHVNSVVTPRHIYMPVYGDAEADAQFALTLAALTDKQVHNVPAASVCHMGGSVRCLSWQVAGSTANTIIRAARRD